MDSSVDIRLCAECHCLAARRTARAITRAFDERLRKHGLRATQFSVLVALELSGAAPISALAEALGMERTTLTRSAALLEKRGWVTSGGTDDRREHQLRLTASGRRKLISAFAAWKAAQDATGAELAEKGSARTLTKRARRASAASRGSRQPK
ncbi:MAG TPA: MarR family transcriptional regulator [Gemmatimonadaceae bacterium]|nr:MarR family transcriptional regulator [Gemmatimonadaceae bacterium]